MPLRGSTGVLSAGDRSVRGHGQSQRAGIGAFLAPSLPAHGPLRWAAVFGATAVNYHGATRTVGPTRSPSSWPVRRDRGGDARRRRPRDRAGDRRALLGPPGRDPARRRAPVLRLSGYARIATLGEEVRDPARTIPGAIPLALGIALELYLVTEASMLLVLGPRSVADSAAPLADAIAAGRLARLAPSPASGRPWPRLACSSPCWPGSPDGLRHGADPEMPAPLAPSTRDTGCRTLPSSWSAER